MNQFRDRPAAGTILAELLKSYQYASDTLLLALPRGGVPVGLPIAQKLHLPLDIFLVRKLGLPQYEELAMGAISLDNHYILNEEIIHQQKVSASAIKLVIEKEKQELQRRNYIYRRQQPFPNLENKTIILIDDGIATGATMKVALETIRKQRPNKIIIAVPIMPGSIYNTFLPLVDDIICPLIIAEFEAVGQAYIEFKQITDTEVISLLHLANH